VSGAEFVVALDVGGSLTKIGFADRRGSLADLERLQTHLAGGPDGLVDWLAEQITRLVESRSADHCAGYGIVVPGIIETSTGTVKAAPNVGWYDIPLRDRLAALTGLSGWVAHDVRSGGLAEWRLGSAVGVSNALFLPLGTGIAGAMIVDGQLLDADGYAGEIGHIRVRAAGDIACACGQVGCLETVASAAGLVRTYARLTADQLAPIGQPEVIQAREVANRARSGEAAALGAFSLAAEALTDALMLYLTLLGPELIVIGGGLSAAADLFIPQISQAIAGSVAFQRVPRIVKASLGADAGVIGAGLVGWDQALRAHRHEQASGRDHG
jgi:glucokinase